MEPAYFTRYDQLRMRRDEQGILEVRLHTRDGPCLFGPRTTSTWWTLSTILAVIRTRGS